MGVPVTTEQSAGDLESYWRAVRVEAGIRDVSCHDLRHAHGEKILTIEPLAIFLTPRAGEPGSGS